MGGEVGWIARPDRRTWQVYLWMQDPASVLRGRVGGLPVPGFQPSTRLGSATLPSSETAEWAQDCGALSCAGRGSVDWGKQHAVCPRLQPRQPPLGHHLLVARGTFSDWPRVVIRSLRLPYPESGPHGLAFTSAVLAAASSCFPSQTMRPHTTLSVPTRERKVENVGTPHTPHAPWLPNPGGRMKDYPHPDARSR